MANYHSWLVTEKCFKVKNPEEFKAELEKAGIHDAEKSDYYGLCYVEEDDGSFWLGGYDAGLVKTRTDSKGNIEEVDSAKIVRDHLRKDETAVFKHVGQTKLRSVTGQVVVVKPYGIESAYLNKIARAIEEKMSPLRQSVKRTQLSS